MVPQTGSTRFAAWGRWRALLALSLAALMLQACLIASQTRVTRPVEARAGDTDADLFRKVVGRVHRGESHYDAYEHVFQEYRYPIRSVFNYRTPPHAWLLSRFPDPRRGQALLACVMAATCLAAYTLMREDGSNVRASVGLAAMLGAFAYGFVADTYLYAEVWSGTLIALSLCAYALGRRQAGFLTGLLALVFRELALPYAVVCLALAVRTGRRKEAGAWGAGLVLYALSLAWHVVAVAPRIPWAGGPVNVEGWVQFGGLGFVLATCRINILLLAAPAWLTALYLPLCLTGLWSWRGENAVRTGLTVVLYLIAFSMIGKLFNSYWGLMYAPLLPLGLVRAPAALRDLAAAAFRPRAISGPGLTGRASCRRTA